VQILFFEEKPMYTPEPPPPPIAKHSKAILALFFVAGLLVSGIVSVLITYEQVNILNDEVTDLQTRLSSLQGFQNASYQTINIFQNETALADLYANVKDSVVMVQGDTSSGSVQGSGFVYSSSGTNVILTNFHVVDGTTGLSVTFTDGNGYAATVMGTDKYSDLAVLSVNAPASELKPLPVTSSSTLTVGEPVIAIGSPYGLVGSLTTGVVSATGRSIIEDSAGGFAIANVIQTSTPINPGNSGGPLLNALGNVIGITTAIVSESQGLGFAIPSNTILREVPSLISTGSYSGHSYLGVQGQDMTYDLAQQSHASVTYGWKIESITSGGPSNGKLQVGDIIIAMDNQTIRNNDDLAAYLEEHTLPGDSLVLTVVRGSSQTDVTVVLGTRPPPS
jgi:S1-C subfamily serine protease